MGWYASYLVGLFALWTFSSSQDRTALRILLIAGVGSFLLTASLRWLQAPWKLVVPATVETLTIIALLRFSPNRTGYMQALLLVGAWIAHFLCYYDLMAGTNIVYDDYERILGVIALGQILACFDTLLFNYHRIAAILGPRGGDIPARGVSVGLQSVEGRKSL